MVTFWALLSLCLLSTNVANGIGSTRVQCPEGHYLSRFSSAFDGSERFYKFGCSKFHGTWAAETLEEKCESTEITSMDAGADVYLSCGSDQYTAGVQIMETASGQPSAELWQFLCCGSESIQVRTADCVETKFINDFRRSSSFSSSAQVIRRWQAMSENGDRRWWLQICPVDVNLQLKKHIKARNDVRARREVPWEWADSRFPKHPAVHPFFHRRTVATREEEYKKMTATMLHKNLNSYAVVGRRGRTLTVSTTTAFTTSTTTTIPPTRISVAEGEEEETETSVDLPKLMTLTTPGKAPIPFHKSRLLQFNERIRSRIDSGKGASLETSRGTPNRQQTLTGTKEEPTEALDYYDMYDENFDKAKHLGGGGILGGVTDFIQSLQDGLTLAQMAFPANVKLNERNGPGGVKGFQLKIAVTPPSEEGGLAFSRDEERGELPFGEEEEDRNLQIGSFVQQTDRKMGPKLKEPPSTRTKEATKAQANTLESMLQMIGLCQGHHEL